MLVTGATGFVGSHLARALVEAGHEDRAMTRTPERYAGAGTAVAGDVSDPASLPPALEGQDAAYYLVHSLASADFTERDRRGAVAFAEAARAAGVGQVVYLGGLGDEGDQLSEHLRSRREVEGILAARVPTTVLRAGIVIGDGGISWEILRQLVARLPIMVTPRWVQTRTQPVALDDAVAFLVGVLGRVEALGQVYDIGGPEPMTYGEMLRMVGGMTGGILRLIVPVPLLSPRLSSHWLRLVTDVDLPTARALIDSMTNEVVVRDRRIEALTGHRVRPSGLPPSGPCRTGPSGSSRMRLPDILTPSAAPREVEDERTVRRRRVVVLITLVVGTVLLGGTLAAPEGSGLFYGFGVLVAATWVVGSWGRGRDASVPPVVAVCS